MGFKTSPVKSLGLTVSDEVEKAPGNEEQQEYITLYRGTTFTQAKLYIAITDITTKCNLLITLYAGQFHTVGTPAAYFSRDRELAECYAFQAAKYSNEKKGVRKLGNLECGCCYDCICNRQESGGLLIFRVPAHHFHGAMIWNEACAEWTQWVHANRNGSSSSEKSAHFDTAPIVEGPCAESHGNAPGELRPQVRKARDGRVMTQVCIKSLDVLQILARCKDVVVEEIEG